MTFQMARSSSKCGNRSPHWWGHLSLHFPPAPSPSLTLHRQQSLLPLPHCVQEGPLLPPLPFPPVLPLTRRSLTRVLSACFACTGVGPVPEHVRFRCVRTQKGGRTCLYPSPAVDSMSESGRCPTRAVMQPRCDSVKSTSYSAASPCLTPS